MEKKKVTAEKHSLPSIQTLLKESLDRTKESLLSFFLITLITYVAYVVCAIVGVGAFFASGGLQLLMQFNKIAAGTMPSLNFSPWILGLGILVALIAFMIVGSISHIAFVLVAAHTDKAVFRNIRNSIPFVLPMFALGGIMFFVIIGTTFFFIFPVVLAYLLLIFASFEVILSGQGALAAMRQSTQKVASHFGAVFLRLVVMVFVTVGISILVPAILGNSQEASTVSFILNTLVGWYTLAYLVTIYRHLPSSAPTKSGSVLWVILWTITILGWILAIFVGYSGYKIATSGVLQKAFQQGFNEAMMQDRKGMNDLNNLNMESPTDLEDALRDIENLPDSEDAAY